MSQVSKRFSRPGQHRHGFTLIEMMVVMGIIVGLAALTLGVKQYLDERAAISQTQMEVNTIAAALEDFKKTYGDYPLVGQAAGFMFRTLTGRTVMKRENDTIRLVAVESEDDWRGFIDTTQMTLDNDESPSFFIDAWGNPYVYQYKNVVDVDPSSPSTSGPRMYTLFSRGPDGEAGNISGTDAQQAQARDNIYPR
ncbi:MAG: prepilin-type N-terminal cleavage/methylation domain-containing protein [Opitutales bacterium]